VLNNSSGFGANGASPAPAGGFASDASFTTAFGGGNENSAAGKLKLH